MSWDILQFNSRSLSIELNGKLKTEKWEEKKNLWKCNKLNDFIKSRVCIQQNKSNSIERRDLFTANI